MKKVIDIHEKDDGSRYIIHKGKKIEIPKGKTKKEDELIFATIMQMILEDEKKSKRRKKRIKKKEAKAKKGGVTSTSAGANPPLPPMFIPGRVGPTVNVGLPQIGPTVNPPLLPPPPEHKLELHQGDVNPGDIEAFLLKNGKKAPIPQDLTADFARRQQMLIDERAAALEGLADAKDRELKANMNLLEKQQEVEKTKQQTLDLMKENAVKSLKKGGKDVAKFMNEW